MPDAEKLAAVRDGLPAVAAGIYLNTPVAGPLPAETARAMADIADWELMTGRANRDRADEISVRVDEARAGIAAIVGTDVDRVRLTHGTTEAMSRLIAEAGLGPKDRVVTIGPPGFEGLSARLPTGIERIVVEEPTDPDAVDDAELVATLARSIDSRTRLVACPHVSATGRVLPIARIGAAAHEAGALLVVDGSQAAGAIAVSVDDLAADFYIVAGWTWLLGPEGIGGVVGRRGDVDHLVPGDVHVPSVVGLARSCGWLSMYVGLDWIQRRGVALAALAKQRLAVIPGVRLLTPGDAATGVTFRIAGWSAIDAIAELGARAFVLAGALMSIDAIRIGTAFFNTEDEIDRFATVVELLASHTPETLPPRRQLTVIGGDR
jgi:L-cysteine/cystine lyase